MDDTNSDAPVIDKKDLVATPEESEDLTSNFAEPTAKKSKKPLIIVVAIFFIVIIGVGAFYFYNSTQDSNSNNSDSGNNQNNDIVSCSYNEKKYEVGETYKDSEKCEVCTCEKGGSFYCVLDSECQSAKDNNEFFKNKIFFVNTKGYEEDMDENLSASKYEVYSFDVETKQKKQLTYMNKDKTLKDMYSYSIKGMSEDKDMILLRNYRSGDDFKTDAVKLNIDSLKWEVLQNYKNAQNSSQVSFLDDGSFSYLNFFVSGSAFDKATMFVNNYNNGVNTELVNKPGFYLYGRGGELGDMSVLRYSPDEAYFVAKNTFYSYGEYNPGGISFGNPIWIYDKNGQDEISVDGTQPSWISNDEFAFVQSEDINDYKAAVWMAIYDYPSKNISKEFKFDRFPYGVVALSNKVLYWNFEATSGGITESETLLYDLETQKTISLGDDFNQSKWLNENKVVMRKAVDCGDIYSNGGFNSECPGMYDGTTLIDLNTVWVYDLLTNKTLEYILNDEGDAVYDYYSFVNFN